MLCVRRYRLIFDDGVVGFVNRCLPRFIIKLALVSISCQNRGCTNIDWAGRANEVRESCPVTMKIQK